MQKIDGGYVFVTRKSIAHLNAQISSRLISSREARTHFGFLEMCSIRKASEALRCKSKQGSALIPNCSGKELSKLTNLPLGIASREIKRVKSSPLLVAEKGKLIPIPRRLIRFLAKCEKRSTMLVLLKYIERGLSLDKGKIKNAGTAKASLISEETGLTIRSIRTARAELLQSGIITPDTTKFQRKLNKDGAYFTINLSWSENKALRAEKEGRIETPFNKKSETRPVDNFARPISKISPLQPRNSTEISPPIRDKISSYEFRNQKPQAFALNHAGVFSKREKKSSGEGHVMFPPTIKNVQGEDLRSFGRMEILYSQAIASNLIEPTEAGAINFLGAAAKARRVEGDSAKIFMGIIKQKLWQNITQADEDVAVLALKKFRAENPDRFRFNLKVLKRAS